MKNLIKYFKMRFCNHDFKSVENSKWYFHKKCKKCGFEKGMGNFKLK